MQAIEGDLDAGEAQATMAAIATRQRGSPYVYWIAVLALMALGAALGWAISWLLSLIGLSESVAQLAVIVGMWGGWISYVRLCQPFLVRQFRRRMSERGLDLRFRQAFTITDEALVLETGSVRRIADWSAVTDVFKVKGYWILLVQMEPWFAPSKFFATIADEKAFIGAVLEHIGPDALGRSKDAVAFSSFGAR